MEKLVKRFQSKLKDEKGQNLVEFAVVLILFLLISYGIIEFGRGWWLADVLKNAANTAARTYAVGSAAQRAQYDASGLIVNGVTVTFTPMTSAVRATASERFQTIVPNILPMLSNITTLRRDAIYRLEQ